MKALQLPVMKRLFSHQVVQAIYVKYLSLNAELKLWEAEFDINSDEGKVWYEVEPASYRNRCGYYAMIGLAPGVWAFLPSFLGKNFRINNDWYTVVYQEHSKEFYDGGYFVVPLTNGDEAELKAEEFAFDF